VPQKSSIPSQKKIKVVEQYFHGERGPTEIIAELDISESTWQRWVILYKTQGADGLIPQVGNHRYAPELKQAVIQEYLAGQNSVKGLCLKYTIRDEHIVRRWIQRYNNHEDFRHPNRGGVIYMGKGRKTTLEERIEIVGHCISNNKDYGKTIEHYGVSYTQIYGWVRRYEGHGPDGLQSETGLCGNDAKYVPHRSLY